VVSNSFGNSGNCSYFQRRHIYDGMYEKMIQCPVPTARLENYDKMIQCPVPTARLENYDKMIQCPVPTARLENYDKILVKCKKINQETKQKLCFT